MCAFTDRRSREFTKYVNTFNFVTFCYAIDKMKIWSCSYENSYKIPRFEKVIDPMMKQKSAPSGKTLRDFSCRTRDRSSLHYCSMRSILQDLWLFRLIGEAISQLWSCEENRETIFAILRRNFATKLPLREWNCC